MKHFVPVGEVEPQSLHGGGVARNVQPILPGGGLFLTDLKNSVESRNLRGDGVAHNFVHNGAFWGVFDFSAWDP